MHTGRWPKSVLAHTCTPSEVGSFGQQLSLCSDTRATEQAGGRSADGGAEQGMSHPTRVPPHLVMSTVVTLNLTPLSQSTMKRRWQKGQFPMFSPSRPACQESRKMKI